MSRPMPSFGFGMEDKWSHEVLSEGFTSIPNLLIFNRCKLGLSTTDMFVFLILESYRWDNRNKPFPSLKALAIRTGLSTQTVYRSTSKLDYLGYIEKVHRFANSNQYDIAPFDVTLQRLKQKTR